METITIPVDSSVYGDVTEIRQVSVSSDAEATSVNVLLADGWKLLHIGHLSEQTVYVLGKPSEQSQRRTGFMA